MKTRSPKRTARPVRRRASYSAEHPAPTLDPERASAFSSEEPAAPPATQTQWIGLVPDDQWHAYRGAIEALRGSGVRFMLGGAFGLACYTGRWRNTKDFDAYILPDDRERAVSSLLGAGFHDFYADLPYDRRWIFRVTRDGFIVDLIWAMANQKARLEPDWFDHASPVVLRGESLEAMAAEELLWCKLYVMQRDRCDWPDLINLLYATGPRLDWNRLMKRVGGDRAMLLGLLSVFSWMAPDRASMLPSFILDQLPEIGAETGEDAERERRRVALLDSRPWFAAHQPEDRPLQL